MPDQARHDGRRSFTGMSALGSPRDVSISDHQQSWGYEEGPPKEPCSHALLVIADFNPIHKPSVLLSFRSMSQDLPATIEPFEFSSRPEGGVAYVGSNIRKPDPDR